MAVHANVKVGISYIVQSSRLLVFIFVLFWVSFAIFHHVGD